MTEEKIVAKIAALLAKAEGTDNAFEAEAFMAKVNELLERHQIELHQLKTDNDPMGTTTGETRLSKSESWCKAIASGVARYYNAKVVWWTIGNNIIYKVVGSESARMTVEVMLPYVLTQIRRAGRQIAQNRGVSPAVTTREVAHALTVRLQRLAWAQQDRRQELVGKGLVPVSDAEAYINEIMPKRKLVQSKIGSYSGEARDAAEKVSLHAQATGKKGGIKLLS